MAMAMRPSTGSTSDCHLRLMNHDTAWTSISAHTPSYHRDDSCYGAEDGSILSDIDSSLSKARESRHVHNVHSKKHRKSSRRKKAESKLSVDDSHKPQYRSQANRTGRTSVTKTNCNSKRRAPFITGTHTPSINADNERVLDDAFKLSARPPMNRSASLTHRYHESFDGNIDLIADSLPASKPHIPMHSSLPINMIAPESSQTPFLDACGQVVASPVTPISQPPYTRHHTVNSMSSTLPQLMNQYLVENVASHSSSNMTHGPMHSPMAGISPYSHYQSPSLPVYPPSMQRHYTFPSPQEPRTQSSAAQKVSKAMTPKIGRVTLAPSEQTKRVMRRRSAMRLDPYLI